jgi:ethanolamine ammonia-lyase small subunit
MVTSRTRQLVTKLRDALGSPVPRVEPVAPRPSAFAAEAARHTTALLGIGHVGTRYATGVVLQFQAELAVAHAAVAAELPDDWAAAHGFVGVASRVTSHREFLLRPDLGRRLSDASLAMVREHCERGVDVQLIVADGLSAVACQATGKQLYDAVAAACTARGLRVGSPIAARYARVWLEDEIGHEVGAKVAMILLGERPGLGTGDGLSAYAVHAPAIGKTDGDRNMISNIHARGIPPDEAAARLAALAAAMIEQQTSGVTLDLGRLGELAGSRGYRAPQPRRRLVNA